MTNEGESQTKKANILKKFAKISKYKARLRNFLKSFFVKKKK